MENKAFVQDVSRSIADTTPTPVSQDFVLGDPASYWLSQRDNMFNPSLTCFPTSVAMVITYLLQLTGKTQTDIGVPEGTQIEDYLARNSVRSAMLNWMVVNVGSWTRAYLQRAWTVAKVEQKEFNDLVSALGFAAEVIESPTYEEVVAYVQNEQIPQVLSGNFSRFSRVQGHITCCIGFNLPNNELIINDPYGYAYDGYKTANGVSHKYKWLDFYGLSANHTAPWLLHIFARSA
jgi:hypothetical protein